LTAAEGEVECEASARKSRLQPAVILDMAQAVAPSATDFIFATGPKMTHTKTTNTEEVVGLPSSLVRPRILNPRGSLP
ncbi:hypothetical protein DVA69_20365, partial [Acinetobacter baumannii]